MRLIFIILPFNWQLKNSKIEKKENSNAYRSERKDSFNSFGDGTMKQKLRKLIFSIFLIIFVLTTNTNFLPIEMASASENQKSNLIEKISKDYTNKFCNSIGFGLSKESAMNFSLSENKKLFKKKKGIQNIDKELLANKIAFSVIDSCGYQLNLFGDKDIKEFASYYLSLDQENA